MARKSKAGEPGTNGVHPGSPVAVADPPTTEQPPREPTGSPAAAKTRPAASYSAKSDRTTCLEVAVWARVVKVGEAEEYTQYSLTVSRSCCDRDDNWSENSFYRVHDVPVLLYLVQQAYQWCVAQRTDVKVGTDGDEPF